MDLGLTYTKIGDYYYPDIALPDTTKYPIGRYGRMHRQYLKEHRPTVWARLVLAGELPRHLFEIDTACNEQMEYLTREMAKDRSPRPGVRLLKENGFGRNCGSGSSRSFCEL